MEKHVLPSGAELEVHLAPFADAKALAQAILEEMKCLQLNPKDEIDTNMWKNIVCIGFSSKKIEACLNKCLDRCLYNGMRILPDTFEPEEARQDYMEVLMHVAKANNLPFVKSLFAKYAHILGILKESAPA